MLHNCPFIPMKRSAVLVCFVYHLPGTFLHGEASFSLPSIAVAGIIFVTPCFVKNFLAVYPASRPSLCPAETKVHQRDWYMGQFLEVCSQSVSVWLPSPNVLILKATKYQLSVYEKWQFYTVSLRPVLHFSPVSALFQTDVLKYKINRMQEVAHTNIDKDWRH